jgi:hypothetical protein
VSELSAKDPPLNLRLLTNHVRAVVLIVRLALGTFHARLYLGSNTNTVTWLDSFDLGSNSQDLANDLVANADRRVSNLPPTSRDCMDIRATDSTAFVLDIDIVILKDLRCELRGR